MSNGLDDRARSEAARERASEWHVRLMSEDALDADWLAFETWLAEDPRHQAAYAAVEQVWADLDAAPAEARVNVAPMRPRPRPRRRWGAVAGLAAASLAAVIGLGLYLDPAKTEVFETPVGQTRQVALADGTRIILNGGSHLEARIGRRERRVRMADAEAVFDVAHDADKPFLIDASDRQVRVVGTKFNLLSHQGEVQVAVDRGVVEVRRADAPDAAPIARLTRGMSLSHAPGQGDRVGRTDPEAALAWTTGRLVFQGEPLEAVARTLERYGATPIVVAPDAANLPVTAVLIIADQDDMLQGLSDFLPVRIEHGSDRVRLSLRR